MVDALNQSESIGLYKCSAWERNLRLWRQMLLFALQLQRGPPLSGVSGVEGAVTGPDDVQEIYMIYADDLNW